jgi:addiction module HigA family antidote
MVVMHNPSHPGRVLLHFVKGSDRTLIAGELGISKAELLDVLKGRCPVTSALADAIGKRFSVDLGLWMRMQAQRDAWIVRRH